MPPTNRYLPFAAIALSNAASAAHAADLAPRYAKAPPLAQSLINWTGCYLGGGLGYGMWNQENTSFRDRGAGPVQLTVPATTGGRGEFATLQLGCDYQFAAAGSSFVVGAFADYDLADMKGSLHLPAIEAAGIEKLSSSWALGGRIGWLVRPDILAYVTGGYTEANFDRADLRPLPPNASPTFTLGSRTYRGYFIGAGDEVALDVLPGLFWKTEYRFSDFAAQQFVVPRAVPGAAFPRDLLDTHKYSHTVRTSLAYRFNWDKPSASATATAAPVAPVNWTGCYVGGGGGYGLWNQDNTSLEGAPPVRGLTGTAGGRGYLATLQAGCDYQFAAKFVAGAFGDYDFSGAKGTPSFPGLFRAGDEKLSGSWSAGGRVGWLATSGLLAYAVGGYTEATFERIDLVSLAVPPVAPPGPFIDKRTYRGWFVGIGDEVALPVMPGLFWKNEYRFSRFDAERNPVVNLAGLPISEEARTSRHTVRSELVYRFGGGGETSSTR